jgi:hypothetical protein
MFWNGFDVPLFVGHLSERPPKSEHVIGKVAFLDERVRPDFFEELVFRHEAAGPGSQRCQNVESLGRQRHRTAIPQQETFRHIERKLAELQANTIVHRGG